MKKRRRRTGTIGGAARSKSALRQSSSSADRLLQPPNVFPSEWHEFLSLLIAYRVKFVIVGAHALAALGKPRNTLDLDVFVEPTKTNAARIGAAIRDFGYPALADVSEEFAGPQARMARIGVVPLRIDVMNHIDGVTFRAAWAGRVRSRIGGLSLAFLGSKEFRRNKRASGRPKDLLDLALLDE